MMPRLRQKSTLALAVLIVAGYLGNYFNLSLFFGVDFLFGSIAVLLVLYFFGLGWGMLAAILTSVQTIFLWNHPYAAIILICEAAFVGYFLHRKSRNILLIDSIYWLFIGMPLVWLFYGGLLNIETQQALLVVLKQSVNGLFNALIAGLITAAIPMHKWAKSPKFKKAISFHNTLLNLFVAFVFFPAISLMIFDGNRVMRTTETRIETELQAIAEILQGDLETWYQQRVRSLEQIARLAEAKVPPQQLQQSTELIAQSFSGFANLYVTDADGNIIASTPEKVSLNAANQAIFKEIKTNLKPAIANTYIGRTSRVKVEIGIPVIVNQKFGGLVYGTLKLNEISNLLKIPLPNQNLQIALVDRQERLIISNQPILAAIASFDRRTNGQTKPKNNGIYQWLPPRGNLPAMVRWKKSFYVKKIPLGDNIPWTLVIESPAEPQINYLQNIYIIDLAITLSITGLALIAARILSHILVKPLEKLAGETTNLPNKISKHEPIAWIESSVTEISILVDNFQLASEALKQTFQEIKSANETLEQRVKKRTDKLVKANKKLRTEINSRKQAEAALTKERNFISAILDTTGALVIVLDPEGKIVRFNRACEELTQYDYQEVEGKYFGDLLIVPEEIKSVKAVLKELKSGKFCHQNENYWVAKDGSRHLIAWSNTVLLNPDNSVQYMIGSGIDITQRKQAEEALIKSEILRQKAEALEQANRIKDEFLAVVSHELRTPLNSILGWSKLLRSRKYDAATTERALETIERNAKSQAQLIEDILEISRIVRGKIRLNLRPVNPVSIIEAAIDSLLPTATTKHISIESKLDAVGLVSADTERLQQVVWNLLSNAIKFTPEGGKIEVKLSSHSQTELGNEGDGNEPLPTYAKISIIDTGKGISPEFLPHVFESFRQADSSITRSHGGLGLGLAIVRNLVELHGGIVKAESPGEGQGATFTVLLPLLETTDQNKIDLPYSPPLPLPPSPLTGLHILVVDDDRDTCDYLVKVLTENEAEVTKATSVEEALAALEQIKPDLLISDIGMPQADGYELIRQIRASPRQEIAGMKAIALTAYTRESDCKQALDAGFQMHLPKPVEPDKLVTAVAKITGIARS